MLDDRYNFAGKKVLVMGLGRFGGGVDCAEFAVKAGAEVIVTDSAPAEKLSDSINKLKEFPQIEYHLGSHDADDFRQTDVVIVNPAVPDDNEYLEIARRNNRFITSQINMFFELCPEPTIGVTGANGKSTTTALTAHLLRGMMDDRRGTRRVWTGGNIGNQPLLTILDKIKADDLVVLELSSFQLEQLAQVERSPDVAVLTNLTPNHLDRHGTFENYCAAKENIFRYQKCIPGLNSAKEKWWGKPRPAESRHAISIFNAEDEIASEWYDKYKKEPGRICIKFSTEDVGKELRESFKLPGRANLSNLAAAMAAARQFGIEDKQIEKSLPEFEPLPHRLEFIAEINGVRWYNDSIATTPPSAIAALESFEQPKIIIAGGYDKNLPFDELGQRISADAKAAVLLGQTAQKIAAAIKIHRGTSPQEHKAARVEIAYSLAQAVHLANQLAEPGDVVLLSPACASYDMFENFQQRGKEFMKLVRAIGS
jgi:UDP-N-acetylmuramoylalanine--D-glutamate ligase